MSFWGAFGSPVIVVVKVGQASEMPYNGRQDMTAFVREGGCRRPRRWQLGREFESLAHLNFVFSRLGGGAWRNWLFRIMESEASARLKKSVLRNHQFGRPPCERGFFRDFFRDFFRKSENALANPKGVLVLQPPVRQFRLCSLSVALRLEMPYRYVG